MVKSFYAALLAMVVPGAVAYAQPPTLIYTDTGTGSPTTRNQPVSPAHPMPVVGSTGGAPVAAQLFPFTGIPVQASGSCTSGTTQLLASGTASRFLTVQVSPSAAFGAWFDFSGAPAQAAPPSVYLGQNTSITWSAVNGFVPTSAVNCISAGSGAVTVTAMHD